MKEIIKKFLREEEGASMAEYAVLIGLITALMLTTINAFRAAIIRAFQAVIDVLP